MSVLMPPTVEEFVEVLKGGERRGERPYFTGADEPGLTCTGAQSELLGGLIDEFTYGNDSAGALRARMPIHG